MSNKSLRDAEAIATGAPAPLALQMVTTLDRVPHPRASGLVSYDAGMVGGDAGIDATAVGGVGMKKNSAQMATVARKFGMSPYPGPFF